MSTKYDRLTLLEFKRIKIKGVGQGAGFRPFVYGLALNDECGMTVETEGFSLSLESFLRALSQRVPNVARVDSLTSTSLPHQDENL